MPPHTVVGGVPAKVLKEITGGKITRKNLRVYLDTERRNS
jgi:hypothetical protein